MLLCVGLTALALGINAAFGAELQRYGYTVLERLPQPRENFVQGLQIVGDRLYVGTGQYGESRLREYTFPAMTLNREVMLDPQLFGEGVTRLADRIYQLTWRAGQLLEYDAASLDLVKTHRISTQGWGITHNEAQLIYSDGSHRLYFLDPENMRVLRTLEVTLGGRPLPRLNELEWIENEVWANVWQSNQLVRIDPGTGHVLGIVDLRGLLDPADRAADTDVLNGIAWDAKTRALWVTGKRWPWLYKIRLVAMPTALPGTQPAPESP
ncbi:MAG: glutaminyl-peptide cyclotransferase [Congregibacter sp.]|nr:glutaminyl-peptide cyclotransferase [Congregibacter sp.]